jgi:hypothetical protein
MTRIRIHPLDRHVYLRMGWSLCGGRFTGSRCVAVFLRWDAPGEPKWPAVTHDGYLVMERAA